MKATVDGGVVEGIHVVQEGNMKTDLVTTANERSSSSSVGLRLDTAVSSMVIDQSGTEAGNLTLAHGHGLPNLAQVSPEEREPPRTVSPSSASVSSNQRESTMEEIVYSPRSRRSSFEQDEEVPETIRLPLSRPGSSYDVNEGLSADQEGIQSPGTGRNSFDHYEGAPETIRLPLSRPESLYEVDKAVGADQKRALSSTSTRDIFDLSEVAPKSVELPLSRPGSPYEVSEIEPALQRGIQSPRSRQNVFDLIEIVPEMVRLPPSRPGSPYDVTQEDTEQSPPQSVRPQIGSLHIRTPSTTAIPLRFRRPPQSPGWSKDLPHGPSPNADISSPTSPSRARASRPKSTEFKSNEFRPLYLVARNTKLPEPEEETFPSLPPSRTESRASSLHDNEDGYESALESLGDHATPARGSPRLMPSDPITPDSHVENDEMFGTPEYLDSQQVTPKASTFPQEVRELFGQSNRSRSGSENSEYRVRGENVSSSEHISRNSLETRESATDDMFSGQRQGELEDLSQLPVLEKRASWATIHETSEHGETQTYNSDETVDKGYILPNSTSVTSVEQLDLIGVAEEQQQDYTLSYTDQKPKSTAKLRPPLLTRQPYTDLEMSRGGDAHHLAKFEQGSDAGNMNVKDDLVDSNIESFVIEQSVHSEILISPQTTSAGAISNSEMIQDEDAGSVFEESLGNVRNALSESSVYELGIDKLKNHSQDQTLDDSDEHHTVYQEDVMSPSSELPPMSLSQYALTRKMSSENDARASASMVLLPASPHSEPPNHYDRPHSLEAIPDSISPSVGGETQEQLEWGSPSHIELPSSPYSESDIRTPRQDFETPAGGLMHAETELHDKVSAVLAASDRSALQTGDVEYDEAYSTEVKVTDEVISKEQFVDGGESDHTHGQHSEEGTPTPTPYYVPETPMSETATAFQTAMETNDDVFALAWAPKGKKKNKKAKSMPKVQSRMLELATFPTGDGESSDMPVVSTPVEIDEVSTPIADQDEWNMSSKRKGKKSKKANAQKLNSGPPTPQPSTTTWQLNEDFETLSTHESTNEGNEQVLSMKPDSGKGNEVNSTSDDTDLPITAPMDAAVEEPQSQHSAQSEANEVEAEDEWAVMPKAKDKRGKKGKKGGAIAQDLTTEQDITPSASLDDIDSSAPPPEPPAPSEEDNWDVQPKAKGKGKKGKNKSFAWAAPAAALAAEVYNSRDENEPRVDSQESTEGRAVEFRDPLSAAVEAPVQEDERVSQSKGKGKKGKKNKNKSVILPLPFDAFTTIEDGEEFQPGKEVHRSEDDDTLNPQVDDNRAVESLQTKDIEPEQGREIADTQTIRTEPLQPRDIPLPDDQEDISTSTLGSALEIQVVPRSDEHGESESAQQQETSLSPNTRPSNVHKDSQKDIHIPTDDPLALAPEYAPDDQDRNMQTPEAPENIQTPAWEDDYIYKWNDLAQALHQPPTEIDINRFPLSEDVGHIAGGDENVEESLLPQDHVDTEVFNENIAYDKNGSARLGGDHSRVETEGQGSPALGESTRRTGSQLDEEAYNLDDQTDSLALHATRSPETEVLESPTKSEDFAQEDATAIVAVATCIPLPEDDTELEKDYELHGQNEEEVHDSAMAVEIAATVPLPEEQINDIPREEVHEYPMSTAQHHVPIAIPNIAEIAMTEDNTSRGEEEHVYRLYGANAQDHSKDHTTAALTTDAPFSKENITRDTLEETTDALLPQGNTVRDALDAAIDTPLPQDDTGHDAVEEPVGTTVPPEGTASPGLHEAVMTSSSRKLSVDTTLEDAIHIPLPDSTVFKEAVETPLPQDITTVAPPKATFSSPRSQGITAYATLEEAVDVPLPENTILDETIETPLPLASVLEEDIENSPVENGALLEAMNTYLPKESVLEEAISTPFPTQVASEDAREIPLPHLSGNEEAVHIAHHEDHTLEEAGESPFPGDIILEEATDISLSESTIFEEAIEASLLLDGAKDEAVGIALPEELALDAAIETAPPPNTTFEEAIETPLPENTILEEAIDTPIPASSTNDEMVEIELPRELAFEEAVDTPLPESTDYEEAIMAPLPENTPLEEAIDTPLPDTTDYEKATMVPFSENPTLEEAIDTPLPEENLGRGTSAASQSIDAKSASIHERVSFISASLAVGDTEASEIPSASVNLQPQTAEIEDHPDHNADSFQGLRGDVMLRKEGLTAVIDEFAGDEWALTSKRKQKKNKKGKKHTEVVPSLSATRSFSEAADYDDANRGFQIGSMTTLRTIDNDQIHPSDKISVNEDLSSDEGIARSKSKKKKKKGNDRPGKDLVASFVIDESQQDVIVNTNADDAAESWRPKSVESHQQGVQADSIIPAAAHEAYDDVWVPSNAETSIHEDFAWRDSKVETTVDQEGSSSTIGPIEEDAASLENTEEGTKDEFVEKSESNQKNSEGEPGAEEEGLSPNESGDGVQEHTTVSETELGDTLVADASTKVQQYEDSQQNHVIEESKEEIEDDWNTTAKSKKKKKGKGKLIDALRAPVQALFGYKEPPPGRESYSETNAESFFGSEKQEGPARDRTKTSMDDGEDSWAVGSKSKKKKNGKNKAAELPPTALEDTLHRKEVDYQEPHSISPDPEMILPELVPGSVPQTYQSPPITKSDESMPWDFQMSKGKKGKKTKKEKKSSSDHWLVEEDNDAEKVLQTEDLNQATDDKGPREHRLLTTTALVGAGAVARTIFKDLSSAIVNFASSSNNADTVVLPVQEPGLSTLEDEENQGVPENDLTEEVRSSREMAEETSPEDSISLERHQSEIPGPTDPETEDYESLHSQAIDQDPRTQTPVPNLPMEEDVTTQDNNSPPITVQPVDNVQHESHTPASPEQTGELGLPLLNDQPIVTSFVEAPEGTTEPHGSESHFESTSDARSTFPRPDLQSEVPRESRNVDGLSSLDNPTQRSEAEEFWPITVGKSKKSKKDKRKAKKQSFEDSSEPPLRGQEEQSEQMNVNNKSFETKTVTLPNRDFEEPPQESLTVEAVPHVRQGEAQVMFEEKDEYRLGSERRLDSDEATMKALTNSATTGVETDIQSNVDLDGEAKPVLDSALTVYDALEETKDNRGDLDLEDLHAIDVTTQDSSASRSEEAEHGNLEANLHDYYEALSPKATVNQSSSSPQLPQDHASSNQDVDFAATLAAGLEHSGFDSNLVVEDSLFHQRASPPSFSLEHADGEFQSIQHSSRRRGRSTSESSEPTNRGNLSNEMVDTPSGHASEKEPSFEDDIATGLREAGFNAESVADISRRGSLAASTIQFLLGPRKVDTHDEGFSANREVSMRAPSPTDFPTAMRKLSTPETSHDSAAASQAPIDSDAAHCGIERDTAIGTVEPDLSSSSKNAINVIRDSGFQDSSLQEPVTLHDSRRMHEGDKSDRNLSISEAIREESEVQTPPYMTTGNNSNGWSSANITQAEDASHQGRSENNSTVSSRQENGDPREGDDTGTREHDNFAMSSRRSSRSNQDGTGLRQYTNRYDGSNVERSYAATESLEPPPSQYHAQTQSNVSSTTSEIANTRRAYKRSLTNDSNTMDKVLATRSFTSSPSAQSHRSITPTLRRTDRSVSGTSPHPLTKQPSFGASRFSGDLNLDALHTYAPLKGSGKDRRQEMAKEDHDSTIFVSMRSDEVITAWLTTSIGKLQRFAKLSTFTKLAIQSRSASDHRARRQHGSHWSSFR